MKKFVTLLLALVMILSMATVASAATITIDPNVTGGTDTAETYKAYKIFDATYVDPLNADSPISYTIDSTTNPFYQVIVDSGYFTLDQINDSGVYNVTKNDTYTNDTAADLATKLKAAITETTPVAGSANAVNEDGQYVIDVTNKGYYLITSSLGSKMIVDTLDDITIDTKNSYPSLTKTADKTTAAYGEAVTFTITVSIPETAVGAIVVHDTLTNLTYKEKTEGDVTVNAAPTDDCSVEFTISAETVAANLGGTVTIKYTATVNDGKNVGNNHAYLTYSQFTSTPVEVTVKNYKLDVFKYTGEEKTGLAGAGFVLKNAVGKYYKYADGVISWVDAIADATEYTTAAENAYTITFEGLANGTYTLVEKTVPAGYNKANDEEVKIENTDRTGATQVEVLNQSGTELPSTGGMGTTMFYVIGGLMMLMAVVLLVTKKRMASAE